MAETRGFRFLAGDRGSRRCRDLPKRCCYAWSTVCFGAPSHFSLLRGLRIARTVVFNEQIQQGLAVGGVISGVIFAGAGAGPAHIHALPFAARHGFGAGA